MIDKNFLKWVILNKKIVNFNDFVENCDSLFVDYLKSVSK